MREIISIKDIDDCDFIIKWRLTDMCNAHCSYCLRYDQKRTRQIDKEEVEKVNKRMCEVAQQINRLLSNQDFKNVKIDLIGGEVSILNLHSILSNLEPGKIKRINITTNFLRDANYYIDLANLLHSKNIRISMTASFHYEFQDFNKYFEKINKVRNYIDIFDCEMVSTATNQDLVKKFINTCKEIKMDYKVEGDLRFKKLPDRQHGLIIDSSKKQKPPRYLVRYSDRTEKYYISRNELLIDPNNNLNRWQLAIYTHGMYCTQSYNYFYIEYDKAVGRTENSDDCKTRIPIEDFKIFKPKICPNNACTLCGHMSLYRNYEDFQKDFES